MRKTIIGVLVLALLVVVMLPVLAHDELSEEDRNFITEYWERRIELQREFIEGLFERGLITEERYEQMMERLQAREEEEWKIPWFSREDCFCRERTSGRRGFSGGMRGFGPRR